MYDGKRKQTRRSASLRRDSARGVGGEGYTSACPEFPFSGCLIDHERENEHEHDQITIRCRYSWRRAEWAGGCELSRTGGSQRTPLGKKRLYRRSIYFAESLSRLRSAIVSLL